VAGGSPVVDTGIDIDTGRLKRSYGAVGCTGYGLWDRESAGFACSVGYVELRIGPGLGFGRVGVGCALYCCSSVVGCVGKDREVWTRNLGGDLKEGRLLVLYLICGR
jgi:hypothetical protein